MKNIKQDFIAHKLNLSMTSYGKIERDEVDVSLTRINQIASILNVSVNYLIGFNVEEVLSMSKRDDYVYQQAICILQENIKHLSSENARLIHIVEAITTGKLDNR